MNIQVVLANYWPAFLFGLFGLAFRWSRMGLPNGGNEPKSILEQLTRIARLWVEASTGSLIVIMAIAVAHEIKPQIHAYLFPLLALGSLLGAALSDMVGQFIQNPGIVFNWTRDTVLKWFGKA